MSRTDPALPASRAALHTSASDVSAVVCTYTDRRWDRLVAAITSLERQQQPLREIIVVVDHNPSLLERLGGAFPHLTVIPNEGPKGLSGARNTGAAAASGDIVASLDDDAEAAPDWSARLAENFADPAVAGVGCSVRPAWSKQPPGWFPAEFLWVVGCTYRGVPNEKRPIRNPLGAAMALRKEVFGLVGGYRSDLGRLNKLPLGCEETELCVRVRQQNPEAIFLQEPLAVVSHYVPDERQTISYFIRRCFAEGISKAAVTRTVGAGDALAAERSYVTRVLPMGVWQGVKDLMLGDVSGAGRSAAIVVGLTLTTAGYLAGKLRGTQNSGPAPALPGLASTQAAQPL